MGTHLVLRVTTLTVGENSWHFVSRKNFKKAFTGVGSHTSGDAVMGHCIDPDDLVGNLDAAIGLRGAKGVTTTKSHRVLTYHTVKNKRCRMHSYLAIDY